LQRVGLSYTLFASHADLVGETGLSLDSIHLTAVVQICSGSGPGSAPAVGWGTLGMCSPAQPGKWHGITQTQKLLPSPSSVPSKVRGAFRSLQNISSRRGRKTGVTNCHRQLFSSCFWVRTQFKQGCNQVLCL